MLPLPRKTHKRSHPRYPIHNIASYHYEDKSVLTLTLDLGQGGMRIKTPQHLPEDAQLNFKLLLAEDSIWPRGRVVYSRFLPDQQVVSGIQFIDLSMDDHTLLQNYLAKLEEWPKPKQMVLQV